VKGVLRISLLFLLAIFVPEHAAPGEQAHGSSIWAGGPAARDSAGSVTQTAACEPFGPDRFPKILPLTSVTVDSVGMAFSQYNSRVLREADSLLQGGTFGPPQSRDARKRCLLYFQLRAWNGIQSVVALAGRSDVVFAGEGDSILIPFRTDYMNAAVYPLQFLKSMQLGGNRFCAEYHAPVGYESHLVIGDQRVRFRTFRTNLPEKGTRLVLSRELLIADGKQVELLYEEIIHGRVLREKVVDRGDSLELLAIYDLAGMYARRAGIHAIGAIVMWKNILQGTEFPANPRVGAIAYLPNLKLRLPFFLPDLGFDDHRDFGYPMPLMRAEFFRHPADHFPDWVESTEAGTIYHWHGIGPRPGVIDRRFPDF
jgi:hypothetical protein